MRRIIITRILHRGRYANHQCIFRGHSTDRQTSRTRDGYHFDMFACSNERTRSVKLKRGRCRLDTDRGTAQHRCSARLVLCEVKTVPTGPAPSARNPQSGRARSNATTAVRPVSVIDPGYTAWLSSPRTGSRLYCDVILVNLTAIVALFAFPSGHFIRNRY